MIKKKEFAIVLTATINVPKNVPFLVLKDSEIRKKQYIDNIVFLLKNVNCERIIFCDNSDSQCPDNLLDLAIKVKKKFEWLTFESNSKLISAYGKGFGEAEILNYVINNSKLLKEVNFFIKITGRLIVRNINSIIRTIDNESNWFLTYGDNDILKKVDTRLYGVRIEDFKNILMDPYKGSNRPYESSIELVYADAINASAFDIKSFRVMPNFIGISGGYGARFYTSKIDEVLFSLRRWRLTRNKTVLIDPIGLWQGDLLIPNEVWNKTFGFATNKKIYICGSDYVGCRFYYAAKRMCKVTGWYDRKYIGCIMYDRTIEAMDIDKIKVADYIFLSMGNASANEIKEYLKDQGMAQEKIVLIRKMLIENGFNVFVS